MVWGPVIAGMRGLMVPWPAGAVELGEFLLCSGETDPEPFDLAELAFTLGLGDAGDEVVADVDEPCPLGRVWSQE